VYADKNAIVLEDLNQLDYKLANRKQRFDLDRAKVVLEKLAKFHAASAALYKNDPKMMQYHLDHPISAEEITPLTFFFIVSMQETLETIRNTPQLEKFASRIEKFDIVEEEKQVFSRSDEESFFVLNHGDLWINNIFFTYDDKESPVDAMMVG
jgi:aminoglycoside phosphotransferase family enzyme